MYIVLFLIIFSVAIRRFLPSKGFLWDNDIDALTMFGRARKIELKNYQGYSPSDLVTISSDTVMVKSSEELLQDSDPGVDLADIKAKSYKEVDTDYMYSNLDSSDSSLSDTLKNGGL